MSEKVILVIDDDEMNLQIAKMVLERKLPCKVIGVDNGVEGIEILKSRYVSLVLLDVMMPDFDGIETLQEIRHDDLIKDVPVMMLTASGDIGVIQKARLLGVTDYVRKPFLPADLVSRVEKKLAEEKPRTEVLIIGDDAKKLKNLKEIIEVNFKHEVLIAANYDNAIDILRDTKMDLIIACGDMNFIDGFRILAFVASEDKFKTVPFAVTTYNKLFKLVEVMNEVNQPKVQEPAKVEKPTVEKKPVKDKSSPVKEPPPVKEEIKKETPLVKEVAESPVAQNDKKKLAKVVTNLIGYDLDVKV
ncbi:MAG: response regulator [Selenomonadaceae bacterium]|nr:response regulator [Selenomonadaceae bacterium]